MTEPYRVEGQIILLKRWCIWCGISMPKRAPHASSLIRGGSDSRSCSKPSSLRGGEWLGCRFSIHARHKKSEELGAAVNEMPLLVPGTENVFRLVMAAESSFGAASYLIRRPEGNIMMDSPRFDVKLLKRIQVHAPSCCPCAPPPPPFFSLWAGQNSKGIGSLCFM